MVELVIVKLVKYKSVILMLKENYYTRKLEIHNDFPKTLLVDIFRPFLSKTKPLETTFL